MSKDGRLHLNEATNVAHLKERDRLVRRIRKMRAEFVLDKNTYEYWNRLHPNEPQIDTSFWDQAIAWCDGKGPMLTDPGADFRPVLHREGSKPI